MNFEKTFLEGVYVITPKVLGDERGWFVRTFSEDMFKENIAGFNSRWLQCNQSFSREKHTWRGFHYQKSPFQESKLVRCISGKVIDYVLDIRYNSPTFMQTFRIVLSSSNMKMVFIPKGCAHGFLTLETNSELVYLHDEYYNPEYEDGVNFLDPMLKLNLPVKPREISQRDRSHKFLNNYFKGII
ncbi:dTDP-4-dehydrorhamnose 3,5-epimerase family protein [bacterium]|nr:dTDP-4-dehydrorhamnose 3,5-epimerase family protein [bacterium]